MFLKQKDAIKQLCDTSDWSSICAFSFNLKQKIPLRNGEYVLLDELGSKKVFKKYIHLLNRSIYRSAYRHHGKRLRIMPFLEKSASGRWHYHVAMEPPAHLSNEEFVKTAMLLWENTEWGYKFGRSEVAADDGWINYCIKRRSKQAFESYYDCVDIDAFSNFVASA